MCTGVNESPVKPNEIVSGIDLSQSALAGVLSLGYLLAEFEEKLGCSDVDSYFEHLLTLVRQPFETSPDQHSYDSWDFTVPGLAGRRTICRHRAVAV